MEWTQPVVYSRCEIRSKIEETAFYQSSHPVKSLVISDACTGKAGNFSFPGLFVYKSVRNVRKSQIGY
jgi:hypothetical protein